MQTATCNLSVSNNVVDFGKLSINRPDTWPRQKLTLTSDSCSQIGMAEMRVLSNGSPKSSDNTLLLNKLTGDSAARVSAWLFIAQMISTISIRLMPILLTSAIATVLQIIVLVFS
ncbi:hypothetical protein CEW81_15235 [Kluyvera genomosp. 3]|uniref:Uncharacterized protein n=1 Tax=Kluyvera genomosp. 3 TaxID=2774055 RepID=A0A248KJ82_9ENTR|nr:hypothetical protein CEW81_15235 [Kluyvera genomosp. 3]